MAKAAREAYEQAVRDLASVADRLRGEGKSEEETGRTLVSLRNDLKKAFRAMDPPEAVALMERRNLAKYGHSIGPDADWFFRRYGNWTAVIEAACRPAPLSDSL